MALRKTSNLTARDRSFGCAPCARSRKGLHAVTMDDFIVEVQGPDIFVRMRGTSNLAIYHKPNGAPELMARGSPVKPIDFRVQPGRSRTIWRGSLAASNSDLGVIAPVKTGGASFGAKATRWFKI
jgi:hypothetical protein